MEQQNYQYQNDSVFVQENTASKRFFGNVFMWMFIALGISAVTAYFFTATSAGSYLVNQPSETSRGGLNIFGYIALFAPIGLVFFMGARMAKLSYSALIGIFLVYAALTGIMLSFILLSFTIGSIAICFAAACAIFGVMAIMGYTTNVDLSQFRSILMAGVIGLVIISLVNMFLGSSNLDYFLGFAGVAIFTALTAFKVQEIKRIGEGLDANGDAIAAADAKKLAIMGALSLYITFINLFVSLLRIFGGRK